MKILILLDYSLGFINKN